MIKKENSSLLNSNNYSNAGVSRSAAIVIGFLISKKGFTFQAAYNLVKKARPAINPNEGFRKQLGSLQPTLPSSITKRFSLHIFR